MLDLQRGLFSGLVKGVSSIFKHGKNIFKVGSSVGNFFKGFGSQIKNIASKAGGWIKDAFKNIDMKTIMEALGSKLSYFCLCIFRKIEDCSDKESNLQSI